MSKKLSPTEVFRIIRNGPKGFGSLSNYQVRSAARAWPERFSRSLIRLNFEMMDSQYQSSGVDKISAYEEFVKPWRRAVQTNASEYFISTVDAYACATKNGFYTIDWQNPQRAPELVSLLRQRMPKTESIAGLPWRMLIAQLESTYSREDAAESFFYIREHEHRQLVSDFYWDTGALTYYSETEVTTRETPLPTFADMRAWQEGTVPKSSEAVVIGMDPNFFRVYGPMVLFNAQQIPELDFVLLLYTDESTAKTLHDEAQAYLHSLSRFNLQPVPENVRYVALPVPEWAQNEVTFYATARFLAIPGLLEEYRTIYSIDADLFIMKSPASFIKGHASTPMSFPISKRLLGVPPWRRYMAGNFIARRDFLETNALQRILSYLSVGLSEPSSWMLDQNALAYAVEGADPGEYRSMSRLRPNKNGSIMASWEQNYKKSLQNNFN